MAPRLGITNKNQMGTPATSPAEAPHGSDDPDLDGCIGTTAWLTSTDAGQRWST
jgi:hypothetical protein